MNKATVAQSNKTSSFISPVQGLLQRKCACGNHMLAGSRFPESTKKNSGVQRKLSIGSSNNPLEQEADRVADQVITAPLNSALNATIQRFSGQASEGVNTAPASVDRILASFGRLLDPALQQRSLGSDSIDSKQS